MKSPKLNNGIYLIFVLILMSLSSIVNAQWYVGPGVTNFDVNATDSTVSLQALGAQGNATPETEISTKSAIPSIAIGRVFGSENQWSVETTIGTSSATNISLNGQPFASVDALPLNVFLNYLGKPRPIGESIASVRPIIGAGVVYNRFTDTEVTNSTITAFTNPNLELSDSVGLAGLLGVNVTFNSRLSIVGALSYVTGLESDVAVQTDAINVFGVTINPAVDANLGTLEFSALITSVRLQYAF